MTTATISLDALRAAQRSVPLGECHAAFVDMSLQLKLGRRTATLFHEVSAAFPKGRRVAVLGHRESGKTTLLQLLLRLRRPTRGRVIVRSQLSWPFTMLGFFDVQLTVRDNLIFLARVIGVDAKALIDVTARVCGFDRRQLNEKFQKVGVSMRRRISVIVILAADFECHLIDGPYGPNMFAADAATAAAFMDALLSRDYITVQDNPALVPNNCNLIYVLYDGRLYAFDDVMQGIEAYRMLPEPERPMASAQPRTAIDEGDEGLESGLL